MPDSTDVAALRAAYQQSGLRRADLTAEPLELWRRWLADAERAGLPEANAMVVSTVDPDGRPSVRTVLCKGADERGFTFFTNYDSRKGRALAAHPSVALLFPWHPLARQVIVNGVAERVSREESEAYFATRPRGAQLSATASRQSQPIADRAALEQAVAAVATTYDGQDVPCPPGWGGFVVRPETIEFWQGRNDRLHDRLRFTAVEGAWQVERLCP
ncbi:MAG TPA: pyridoxamine 5'-phosphate oxidase [Mycobacteriales bacterium]|nr:pyridoxamine 5'-phosphate oxidase [Mycobacteriales bacterium]